MGENKQIYKSQICTNRNIFGLGFIQGGFCRPKKEHYLNLMSSRKIKPKEIFENNIFSI